MPASAPALSREDFLINDTLIPLLRFMAHRFKGYRAISDARVKQAIARLETVSDLPTLAAALEHISASAIAKITEEK